MRFFLLPKFNAIISSCFRLRLIIDNSESPFKLIAEGFFNIDQQINDQNIWNQINQHSNGK